MNQVKFREGHAKKREHMTRTTNARVAGFTYLFYIAVGVPAMILLDRATGGQGVAAKLASVAQHAGEVRVAIVLSLITCFAALVLGVTLYGVTREEDNELALLGLSCRVGEGVLNAALGLVATLGLLWLGTAPGPGALDAAAVYAAAAFLLKLQGWSTLVSATFFAAGSALFSYLLLRGRMVPVPLAWLGVVASVLLVAGLPLQLAGLIAGPFTLLMWLPMLAFEVPLGFWLLVKGMNVQVVSRQ